MTLETTARAIEFAFAVKDECENHGIDLSSGEVTDICRKLLRQSKTVHRLDEYHCNYEENEGTKRAEASALKKAEVYARILGAEVFHQGDPRGWPLYLIFKGDLQTDQDVHAVYNSVGVAVPPNY